MRNGTIIINGDAGDDIGESMVGGVIHLNGKYKSIS